MTKITFVRRRAVISRLALCNHIVMTYGTTSQYLRMVNTRHGTPGHHTMAGVALIRTADVTGTLTGGDNTVVASCAISQYIVVIDHRRRPTIGVMTVLAKISRANVIRRLSGRTASVMTLDAPGNYTRVREIGRRPCDGGMTHITLTRGDDVIGRLSGRSYAVVAG